MAEQTSSILLIEDEPHIRLPVSRYLQGEGYQVDTGEDGPAGLAKAQATPPDLILLDIGLPGMDGFEVCRQLKAAPETQTVPVLFFSSQHETDAKVAGLDLGAQDFITKPFEMTELLARVRAALRIKHLEDELRNRNLELEESNQRAFDRLTKLSALYEVSSQTIGNLKLDSLMVIVVTHAGGALNAQVCELRMLTDGEGPLKLESRWEATPEDAEAVPGTVASLLAERALERGRSVRLPDPEGPDLNGVSALCVPLKTGSATLGTLSLFRVPLQDHGAPAFDSDEQQMVETFASLTGISVENARLFSNIRSREGDLQDLVDLGTAITSTTDLREVLQRVVSSTAEMMGAEACMLRVWDEQEGTLAATCSHGIVENHYEQAVPVDDSLAGKCLTEAAPLLIDDARDSDLQIPKYANAVDADSMLCVPLRGPGEKPVGTLSLCWDGQHNLEESDIHLIQTIAAEAAVATRNAQLVEALRGSYLKAIESLSAAVETKDVYTKGHSERVSRIAVRIAQELELPEERIEAIRLAALLHDVGKIGTMEGILLKPGRLEPLEFELMKDHLEKGLKIVQPIDLPEESVEAIRHHHERYDGRGYPGGLSGDAIPLAARVLQVADTLDAISSNRPYRPGRPAEYALRELRTHSRAQFDPAIVDTATQCFDDIRQMLESSSGTR